MSVKTSKLLLHYLNLSGNQHVSLRGIAREAKQQVIEDCMCNCQNRLSLLQIRRVFSEFWAIANHEQQNHYLRGCIEVLGTENINGNRKKMYRYKVKLPEFTVNVCRKFFLGLHGINESRIRRKVGKLLL